MTVSVGAACAPERLDETFGDVSFMDGHATTLPSDDIGAMGEDKNRWGLK
jgi:hypothetical protein